jgi:hypothetical protein
MRRDDSIPSAVGKSRASIGGESVIWLLVIILAVLAIGGGVALTKFLFLLLIAALVLAVVGAFSRTA